MKYGHRKVMVMYGQKNGKRMVNLHKSKQKRFLLLKSKRDEKKILMQSDQITCISPRVTKKITDRYRLCKKKEITFLFCFQKKKINA